MASSCSVEVKASAEKYKIRPVNCEFMARFPVARRQNAWHPVRMTYFLSHRSALQVLGSIAATNGVPPMYAQPISMAEASGLESQVVEQLLPVLRSFWAEAPSRHAEAPSRQVETCGDHAEVSGSQAGASGCQANAAPLGLPSSAIGGSRNQPNSDGPALSPVDILVPADHKRHRTSHLLPHQWKAPLPPGSLLQLTENVVISSPEFCYLQMASVLSRLDLLLLGYSMCGTYHPAWIQKGFVQRRALTDVERLRRYLENVLPGTFGVKKARSSLKYLVNNSNSPMETCCVLELVLPGMLGGYGLCLPKMNQRIDLSPAGRQVYGHAYCKADVIWNQGRFVLEYLGPDYHVCAERDLTRTTVLEGEGYRVREVAFEQVRNGHCMAEIARSVNSSLGRRTRAGSPSDSARRRKEALRRQLYPRAIQLADGTMAFPKPDWALPAGFSACVEEEHRHQELLRANARLRGIS